MSRYDQPSEPDLDRYETRTDDIDVPDFDQPDPPVDPAEQAAHTLAEALLTLEREIGKLGKKDDLARMMVLMAITRQQMDAVNRVQLLAHAMMDRIIERRR